METTYKYKEYEVHIEKRRYGNNRVALALVEGNTMDPIAVATVNLPEYLLPDGHVLIKSYSENEGMLRFLMCNNIIDEPIGIVTTGYTGVYVCKLLI